MRSIGVATLAVAFSFSLLSGSPSVASQRNGPEPEVDLAATDVESPELDDAAALATGLGISVKDAVARTAGQNEFVELVDTVRLDPAVGFVDAEWFGETGSGGVIRVNRAVDLNLQVRASKLTADVKFEYVDAPSEAQRELVMEKLGDALWSRGVIGATISSDGTPTAILVEVPLTTSTHPEDSSRLRASQLEEASSAIDVVAPNGFDITIAAVAVKASDGYEYRGGFNYAGCTGGFVVKSGSKYGMSTAGHCPWDKYYDSATFAMSPIQGTMIDLSNRDVKWNQKLTGSAQNLFRASSSNVRNVLSASNPVVGASVCKYGLTTGQTCSTIYKANFCRTSGAGTECGFYSVTGRISDNGDSGGPWYWGSKGHGIHSGTYTVDGESRSTCAGIGALNLANAVVYVG